MRSNARKASFERRRHGDYLDLRHCAAHCACRTGALIEPNHFEVEWRGSLGFCRFAVPCLGPNDDTSWE